MKPAELSFYPPAETDNSLMPSVFADLFVTMQKLY